jgi:LEA14-like dessication related protein
MRIPIIPTVKIEDVKILDFGLDDMRMLVTVSINNPNNIDFTIKHMKSSVQVKDYAKSYSESDYNFHVKKFGVSTIQIPVNTDMKHELKATWKVIKGDTEWPYFLRSEMVLDPSDEQIDDIQMESQKQGVVDVKEAMKKMKNKEKVGVGENNQD